MNWFQRLRRYIIIKTAESYYNKMANQCNELHKQTRQHHYIIIDPWLGKKIIITNRANFRATKNAINSGGIRMAVKSRYQISRELEQTQFQLEETQRLIHKKSSYKPWKDNEEFNKLKEKYTKLCAKKEDLEAKLRVSDLVLTDSTMPDVHNGCYYSSLLQTQLDKLMEKPEENARAIKHLLNDIEARRRSYIQWTLDNAKIRQRKTFKQRREERAVRRELRRYKNRKK